MRAPRSLRARITLAALAAVVLSGTIAGALLLAAIQRDYRNAVDANLQQRATSLVRQPWHGPFDDGDGSSRLLAGSGTYVQVQLGNRLARQGDIPANAPGLPLRDGLSTLRINGQAWRALTVTLDPADGLRLEVLSSLAPVEARVAQTRHLVIWLGLLALVLTAISSWAFTTVALRPLARLRAGAERVSGAEDLSTTLPDEGPDEVRSLAQALNEMLARLRSSTDALQRALQATRRFAADAGHELRTPLTGMRATLDTLERNPDLDVAQRQTLVHEMAAEQDRIVHLLEGLQALARGEAADTLPREDVEIGDLVDASVYAARRRHPTINFELEEQVADAAVHGWANGLRLVIDNLLDNAALHGRPHGRVLVGIERADGALIIHVDDNGSGIAEDERERVLEPFARGPTSSSGTGLGLAIVAQQVALHGGKLELAESAMGGLRVIVRLPLSEPEQRPPDPARMDGEPTRA